MSLIRPGKFEITDKAMELCGLKEGAKVLDVGCGDGTAAEYLQDKYGYEVTGIDMNLAKINEGKERNGKLDLRMGDGEFLDDFPSFSFDCVMMECTLSLINLPDEALHEAYCVLKKGGKLFISDLYMKNPDPRQVQAIKIEAERQAKIPHKEENCGEGQMRFVDFRFEGAFIKDPMIRYLEEVGYEVKAFEDRSADLDTYVAETILQEGSLDNCITCAKGKKGVGYFMLVAEKPAK
ncbi:class I SAM-dependent methyltransferase [Anaerovorax odorimutans]|uniref:Class I SAM-dependent methyltransferase n=1 Tax=Anaerovorax odorimutans TaxID=109327 RepID=A0ABT1RNS6_9FIRM|nr:class I SAM-dependent methyltransferase [Anaerovorax odorimutans]MCQ4636844.1 class I SAM-dependent methyltransferase [Anaerovorax odorimutans]